MEQNGLKMEESEKLEETAVKLKETENKLITTKKEISTYQNMLEQSQNQYLVLEKKYTKAKQLVRDFQQRELDLMHREDFYQQLLQEKDTEYNSLVKNLKDRIISLEQELLETQRKAGVPIGLPYDNITKQSPQLTRRQPLKPTKLETLETDLSDTEISDASPDDDKTATVERKLPIKEEFDKAVPPHELLDISANKSRAELANRGALANRQLPSGKKGSLSNSSSDYGLDESCNSGDELNDNMYIHNSDTESKYNVIRPSSLNTSVHSHNSIHEQYSQNSHYIIQNTEYTQVHKSQPVSTNAIYAKIQKDNTFMQHTSPDPWIGSTKSCNLGLGPPSSLAEQLKQVVLNCDLFDLNNCYVFFFKVLAEREKRMGSDSITSSIDDLNEKSKNTAQHLLEEIRQAVNEASSRGNNSINWFYCKMNFACFCSKKSCTCHIITSRYSTLAASKRCFANTTITI